MSIVPVEIRRDERQGLHVRWSDGSSSDLSASVLRTNCPCATCREARGEGNHERPLSGTPAPNRMQDEGTPSVSTASKKRPVSLRIVESSLSEELALQEVWPVGNYAIGLRWGDGHSTGIYPYSLLYVLAKE